MTKSEATTAQQIARAASAFERRLTGHAPKWVTVVLWIGTVGRRTWLSSPPLLRATTAALFSHSGLAREMQFFRIELMPPSRRAG